MNADQARKEALEVIKGTRRFEKQFAHANKMLKGMAKRGQFSVRFSVTSKESSRVLAEAMKAKLTQDGYSCVTEYSETPKTALEKGKVLVKVSSL